MQKWMKYLLLFLLIPMFFGCLEKASDLKNIMHVRGKNLYTSFGDQIVLRGVNEMFIWSDDLNGEKIIPEIAKTGANTVRIVWLTHLGNPRATPENLDRIIQTCIDNQMVPMPELHGATGKWDKLKDQVDYWTDPAVVKVLKKHESYLLLNIANECGGHQIVADTFKRGYMQAIDRLRATGLKCPLVIDASGWGQDLDILLETGPALLEHDPLNNLVFSIHMWWVAEDGSTDRIVNGIEESVKLDLPLIVGEFAPMGVACARSIDYHTIMAQCEKHKIGWLAWSWGYVKNGDCSEMDMTLGEKRGLYEGLAGWGLEVAVTHPLSIKNTSVRPRLR